MDYENQKIIGVEINNEMKKSFIDYAMSVIVARALPDVRDGLKPVHRRILYTMYEDNLTSDRAYRKSATTVGAVLGKYHPHGDMSVYDALVRMAQSFSLRYPLIDGHGNFGSIDGDPPAAYRYTEARMAKISNELLTEIEKNTVDFSPNYDEKLKEPDVLPARFPNLLVNGSSGIAVGMATNIPPHNLREVIDGTICLIDNPEATVDELMEFIKGPDFPTAGTIMGRTGIRCAYATGKGRVFVRAKTEIVEHRENRFAIIISEIPYQVNKTRLIENIAELVKDKRVEGISDMRDESSDRAGMRIVIELKRDANPQLILNQLYQFTQMQDTFSINMLALVNNEPKVLSLRQILGYYIDFQKEIIVRRTRFDLKKAEDRAHILEGLRIALDNIDEVISTIRTSYNDARERLMERFGLSDLQSQAILDMRLARLQGLEREKIDAEYAKIEADIKYFKEILASEELVLSIVKQELLAIRDKYGDDRKTAIEAAMDDFNCEDLIEREDCVITRTHFGYIKRMPVNTYKAQKRGGKGITGMTTREEDFVEELFIASTHSHILFFTDKGRVFRLKGYNIPEASRTAKGTNMVNLLQVEQGEKVTSVIHLDAFDDGMYLTMVTTKGVIKRTDLKEYDTARRGGLKAILLEDDDLLVNVCLTDGKQRLLVASTNGKAIRFDESDVRPMGRVAHGVRAIKLRKEDTVVGMVVANETGKLLTVTQNGYGKRTEVEEYKVQTRGGTGIFNYNLTDKTGKVAGIMMAEDTDDVILISSDGIIIRFDVKEIPVYARVTQGVRVMRLDEGVSVVTLARTEKEEEDGTEAAEIAETPETVKSQEENV